MDLRPVLVLLLAVAVVMATGKLPTMRDGFGRPVHARAGDDALITCVVRGAGNLTVMWKREDPQRRNLRVLTAGATRVSPDPRYDVLHDAGGDVWVLVVKGVRPSDAGLYVCEVNSDPAVRSFHKLNVLVQAQEMPRGHGGVRVRPHNYTACCAARNVSQSCFGLCDVQNILDGNTGAEPQRCVSAFPDIVGCMADGRNHVPCCTRQRVPEICQGVCRGEYVPISNTKTDFSCAPYTESTLACIAEGVELLPRFPENVQAESLTARSLNVSWTAPRATGGGVTAYVLNVTRLRAFDPDPKDPNAPGRYGASTTTTEAPADTPEEEPVTARAPPAIATRTLTVPGTFSSAIVGALQPSSMYEVRMVARNRHGESLPSYGVRTTTLPLASPGTTPDAQPPSPDVRACCEQRGVTQPMCLDNLCDPAAAALLGVADLMSCAAWAAPAFSCLANGDDLTACCRARGLPGPCLELCAPNVTTVRFSHFNCLTHMPAYATCLLQGYGVLPSAPRRVHVTNVGPTYALVNWLTPHRRAGSALYAVRWRALGASSEYGAVAARRQPFVLEGLRPSREYEIYVEAVGTRGAGAPSSRVIFRTESQAEQEQDEPSHNVTDCCGRAGLSGVCMPLCSYDASVENVKALANMCAPELHKLVRCGAAGRDHSPCCARRGVPTTCASVCAGVLAMPASTAVAACSPYLSNIVLCFEEGTGLLPGPVEELQATRVRADSATLRWEPPRDTNVTHYVVHYHRVQNSSRTAGRAGPPQPEQRVNATDPSVEVVGLQPGDLYSFFVVAHNAHGASLPSAVVLINASDAESSPVTSVTSPPHSLTVSGHSATWLAVTWQPPQFSKASERIAYRLYYKTSVGGRYRMVETSVTSHMLEKLQPDTQYMLYTVAMTDKGSSLPSETLLAWTDSAYAAVVEAPAVQPATVTEGGSIKVLCIALGTPTPTISLYISGRLIEQEVTRHMMTDVNNVTREMDHITCYVDNGYGTPMQASRKIVISYPPHITPPAEAMADPGSTAMLECRVQARPQPKLVFWKDHGGRVPIIQGDRYNLSTAPGEEETEYVVRLTIQKVEVADAGDYFCHAENKFGASTEPLTLRVRMPASPGNMTACCTESHVSPGCMDACAFYLEAGAVDWPACVSDLHKLVKCAADGRDHRGCCAKRGVPRHCLDWCRGQPPPGSEPCVLHHSKIVLACFQEGRERLPGPPQGVRVEPLGAHAVRVLWDPPVKNPSAADTYRVLWRQRGSRAWLKNDTRVTWLRITGLEEGAAYECAISAGNRLGSSAPTAPLLFSTGAHDSYVTSSTSVGECGPRCSDVTTEAPRMRDGEGASTVGASVVGESTVGESTVGESAGGTSAGGTSAGGTSAGGTSAGRASAGRASAGRASAGRARGPATGDGSARGGVAAGAALGVLALLALAATIVWFVRRRRLCRKSSAGVAFENPSYLREMNMDRIQIPSEQSESPPAARASAAGPSGEGASGAASTVPVAAEVAGPAAVLHEPFLHEPLLHESLLHEPLLHEELQFGEGGTGFKRLK